MGCTIRFKIEKSLSVKVCSFPCIILRKINNCRFITVIVILVALISRCVWTRSTGKSGACIIRLIDTFLNLITVKHASVRAESLARFSSYQGRFEAEVILTSVCVSTSYVLTSEQRLGGSWYISTGFIRHKWLRNISAAMTPQSLLFLFPLSKLITLIVIVLSSDLECT